MIKKHITKKIIITISLLFSILLICLVPNKSLNEIKSEFLYTEDLNMESIYLLDKNNYLGLTQLVVEEEKIEDKIKHLINSLIEDSSYIPSGFRGLISSNTKINNIEVQDNIVKIDFNKYVFEYNKEKALEALIYTLTSLNNIDKVTISIDNNIIGTFDRSYGINKEYKIDNYKDVSKITVYYLNEYNNNNYYVPVTKYINTNEDKIDVIIKELKDNDNLISHLSSNVILLDKKINNKELELTFNEYIYDDIELKKMNKETENEINYSIKENLDIDKIIIKTKKTIE